MHTPARLSRNDASPARAGLLRMEEASLNATAVREQQLYDGWLLRWAPSAAKRARSVNVLAPSAAPLDERLDFARALYARHGLPLVFRLTELCPDPGLDEALGERGFTAYDETFVMSAPVRALTAVQVAGPLRFRQADASGFAAEVGRLRGVQTAQVGEHAQRLLGLAVRTLPVLAYADGVCVGAALGVLDGDLMGVFDVSTHSGFRRRGIATALMNHLMACAAQHGITQVYLQVEPGNAAARSLYARLGYTDRYRYWYRSPPDALAG